MPLGGGASRRRSGGWWGSKRITRRRHEMSLRQTLYDLAEDLARLEQRLEL